MLNHAKPMTIAFGSICSSEWIAGCHYLKNLFVALKMQDNAPILSLIDMRYNPPDSYQMLLPYLQDVLVFPPKRPFVERVKYALQLRTHLNLGALSPMGYLLKNNNVDLVFSIEALRKPIATPWIVWIPDFQHLHLPQFFTEDESKKRTENFHKLATEAQVVVLSSQHALADLRSFSPENAHKGHVLNFVAQVDPKVYDVEPHFVCQEYNLPEKFFYLPNQFWQHKNHEIVIEALAILRESHPHITVVCTGNINDHRQPRYFSELLGKIAQAGVHKQFIVLGMIPQEHIFPLMRQSVAVLQPSLFEGWSTTVEETKSLGKAIVLSDIPVHREQNPPASRYFDPKDAQSLAQCLIDVDRMGRSGADYALEASARAQLPERMKAFGKQFMEIAHKAFAS